MYFLQGTVQFALCKVQRDTTMMQANRSTADWSLVQRLANYMTNRQHPRGRTTVISN